MAVIDHVNWASLDRLVLNQQRNRSAYVPVISLFRWWARRPHCFAGAVLDAAKLEFDSTSFLVSDPFSGGGTVAFEAVGRGLPVYAQDLYPWPSQGLAIALTSASASEFENSARSFLEQLRPYREAYWRTESGQLWETTHVIRVRTSHCVECGNQLFLFREPLISLASRSADEKYGFFGCRACGTASRRNRHVGSFACDACQRRSTIGDGAVAQRPPRILCPHCVTSIDLGALLAQTPEWHPVLVREQPMSENGNSTARLRPAQPGDPTDDARPATSDVRRSAIPEGLETGHLRKHGFQFWEDLYTNRQLAIINAALDQLARINNAPLTVKGHLRLAVLGATEMAGYICRWERYHPKALEAIANHRFSRSTVAVETNLLSPTGRGTLPRRFEAAARALHWLEKQGYPRRTTHNLAGSRRRNVTGALVVTGSSQRQLLKDGAAQLVFTDPPYHDDLQYGELSRLFHAWMNGLSESAGPCEAAEAVPNAARGTDTQHYEDVVAACLTESNRSLARDGRLVLTFHNKDLYAWEALARALRRASFLVVALATVAAENPDDHSKRGKETFLSDLVIECRPRSTSNNRTRPPKVLGLTRGPERRNLVAIGLALADHVNRGQGTGLEPLFREHLKALRTSHVLIRRGGR